MRDAVAHQRRRTRRHKERQALYNRPACVRGAAGIQPQDSERQCGIDRRLQFLRIHSEHGKGGLPSLQQSAHVDGAKGMFKVHGMTELHQR